MICYYRYDAVSQLLQLQHKLPAMCDALKLLRLKESELEFLTSMKLYYNHWQEPSIFFKEKTGAFWYAFTKDYTAPQQAVPYSRWQPCPHEAFSVEDNHNQWSSSRFDDTLNL